jgi:hypothetical protein
MKYLPLKFHVLYITFTLLFSFFGPKVYDNFNKPIVLLFMFVYLSIVIIGFRAGFNSKIKVFINPEDKREKLIKLLQFCIKVSVVLFFINIIFLYSTDRLNIQVSSVGAKYADYYDYYIEKTDSALFTFEIIFLVVSAIPKFIALALGFYYFNRLSSSYKILFITFILLILVTQTLSLGNQKSIGDIAIFGAIALLIKAKGMEKTFRKRLIKKTVFIVFMLFLFLSFSQYSRLSSRGISAFDINSNLASYSHFDLNHPIFSVLGYKFGLGISYFISGYLSGGYYGLSMALQLPFEWTYGIGNSVSLSSIVEKLFNTDIYSSTYLHRIELAHGIPGKKQWHTIFPWLASDFTFIGTLIIFYFFSYFYGKSWKEVMLFNNPVSILLFSLLSILFIFVPANNQIFHGFDYLLITSFVFVLWSYRHIDFNVK